MGYVKQWLEKHNDVTGFLVLDWRVDTDEKNEQRLIRNENGSFSLQFRPFSIDKEMEWKTFYTTLNIENAETHFLTDFNRKADSFGF